MAIAPGQRFGPYEIVSPVGAGGMGEVYRARDTRLARDVALKVLPPEHNGDRDRLDRFEREARAVAALSHPHILSVFDVGAESGVSYVVFELLEGETLRERLESGALPPRRAVEYALQIGRGLAAAHSRGIVHRDLKPDNLFVTADGQVKILDFGLAKLTDALAGAAARADKDTATDSGVVLGTTGYMSPEQVRGHRIDARSDIFALGAVLHEMLSGRRAFDGESTADVLSAILHKDPPSLAGPAALERIVRRCLEKDAEDRFQTARDLAFALENVSTSSGWDRLARPAARLALVVAVIAAGLAAGRVTSWRPDRLAGERAGVVRALIDIGPATALPGTGRLPRTAVALSPDGQLLVFSGVKDGTAHLFARPIDRDAAAPIPGTEDGAQPFFSPDGRWIGFWARGALRRVPVAGGPAAQIYPVAGAPPVQMMEVAPPFGACFAADGSIMFAYWGGGIRHLHPGAAEPEEITTLDLEAGELSHRLPGLLPGDGALLYTALGWERSQIVVRTLAAGGERKVLVEDAADGRYVPSGHLVYTRRGSLFAAAFDPVRLTIVGPEVGLMGGIMQALLGVGNVTQSGAAQVGFSQTGSLVYLPGGYEPSIENSLGWIDRRGTVTVIDGLPLGTYLGPRLSPDGRQIAVMAAKDTRTRVQVYDTARGTLTTLVGERHPGWPVWTPDGRSIVLSVMDPAQSARLRLTLLPVEGGALQLLSGLGHPASFTPDGQTLLYIDPWSKETDTDIRALSPSAGFAEPPVVVQTKEFDGFPMLSPDGRSLAYVSYDSGRSEVYIRPFPGQGRVKVSTETGEAPMWSRDGRELFYLRRPADGGPPELFVADIARGRGVGRPRLLFRLRPGAVVPQSPLSNYDVAADGRFLFVIGSKPADPPAITHVRLVLNWFDELRARAPVQEIAALVEGTSARRALVDE